MTYNPTPCSLLLQRWRAGLRTERLPKKTFAALKNTIDNGEELDAQVAEVVANAYFMHKSVSPSRRLCIRRRLRESVDCILFIFSQKRRSRLPPENASSVL